MKEFPRDGLLWSFANYWGEFDILDYAESLLESWEDYRLSAYRPYDSPDFSIFKNEYQIRLALMMSVDGVLPQDVDKALSMLMLSAMREANDNKYKLETLHLRPPPRGRKEDWAKRFSMVRSVIDLLNNGTKKKEAYEKVGLDMNVSPETVRRSYERMMKSRKKAGK